MESYIWFLSWVQIGPLRAHNLWFYYFMDFGSGRVRCFYITCSLPLLVHQGKFIIISHGTVSNIALYYIYFITSFPDAGASTSSGQTWRDGYDQVINNSFSSTMTVIAALRTVKLPSRYLIMATCSSTFKWLTQARIAQHYPTQM